MNPIVKTFDIGDGRTISLETGRLARQAHGAVLLTMGNTMLLATVVSNKEAKDNVDFMPLTVDYVEKFAAVGRIPGSFLRREGRVSDYEVLICRIVDRALRPLFPDDYHADTQVMISLISSDDEIMPDALAGLAASAAIAVSDIPFNGPVSEVRVAKIDGKLCINPNRTDLERAEIDFIVAGTEHDLNMVEGEANEISEADMIEAIKFAHDHIKIQVQAQKDLAAMVGVKEKRTYNHETNDEDLRTAVNAFCYQKIYDLASRATSKNERGEALKAIKDEFKATLPEDEQKDKGFLISKYFHDAEYDAVRAAVLDNNQRLDGRALNQVRPIWCEVSPLPSPHGSALFTRGETQSLTSVTLGSKLDEQLLDSPLNHGHAKFMLHYNFPAFSTGEARPNRASSRREIGHGNLALRAIRKAMPGKDLNPYTIRIVSDVLESNGSSSMATVCASSMAMFDAGIKMKSAVSGIAMGMISDEKTGRYAVLSDILGDEDHLGDMDFKVCGTEKGIVACQMDLKVNGLKWDVLAKALEQSKEGRLHILGKMNETIAKPNSEYKPHAPRIETLVIDTEFIGAIIGPGGKVIQQLQKDSGTTISITEEGGKGYVEIMATNGEGMDMVKNFVNGVAAKPVVGEEYVGKVRNIQPFGAFVEFLPGKDGLLHISEISWKRLETVEGVLAIGDEVRVKLIEVDPKTGKYRLSRKVLLPKEG